MIKLNIVCLYLGSTRYGGKTKDLYYSGEKMQVVDGRKSENGNFVRERRKYIKDGKRFINFRRIERNLEENGKEMIFYG